MKRSLLSVRIISLAWLLQYLCFSTFAQPLRFENYSTENGLTRNIGYDIAQTPEGFMWFATPNGLNRFDGYQIKVYKADPKNPHSLCANTINALLTDDRGNLWIGTPQGTCIYQPVNDKFYKLSELYKLPKTADSLAAMRFQTDRDGTIWILTTSQGLYSCPKNKTTIRQQLKASDLGEPLRSTALTEDGRISISSMNEIHVFDGHQFKPVGIRSLIKTESTPLYIREFAFVHGELWVGSTFKGLFRFRMSSQPTLIEHITTRTPKWNLTHNSFECLLKDKKNNLWIGSINDGLFQYNFSTGTLRSSQTDTPDTYSLPNNYVISLFEDRQGIVWAGLMGGGIARCDPEKSLFQTISLSNRANVTPKPDDMTMGIFTDDDKTFYVGTLTGGMIRAEDNFKKLTIYRNEPGQPHSIAFNRVDAFVRDNTGALWVAGAAGLCLFDPNKKPSEAFTSFPYDESGKYPNFYTAHLLRHQNALLLSGISGLSLFNLTTRTWQPLHDVAGFAQKQSITARYVLEPNDPTLFPKGTILLCTEKTALLLYNYLTGTFREYPKVATLSPTIRYAKMANRTVWMASDNGLIKMPINNPSAAQRFGENEGLPDDVIYSLQIDKRGQIWVGTSQGICKFDTTQNRFTCYGASYGLSSTEFNTASTCVGRDGQFYFGGTKGITTFLPTDFKPSTFSPPALLTGMEVMNKDFSLPANSAFTKQISLHYQQNFITFHFSTLNFFQTPKTTYQYKLEGVDRDWEQAGSRNFATYTNLAPGDYTFQMKGINSEGIPSNVTTAVLISIIPPFWQTNWFYTLILLTGLGIGYAFYKNRQAQQILKTNLAQEEIIRHQQDTLAKQKEANLLQKISAIEMTALRSQMNPHFIFNCLNSIKSYALNNDTENVSLYLTRFSRLIRLVLENSQSERINLNNELETLRLYMQMEKLRFGDHFDFTIRLADNLETEFIEVPPMLIQPYVENAIWHGLMHKQGTGHVLINVTQPTDDLLRIVIEDDGIGRIKANEIKSKTAVQKKSFGMKITSERLDIIRQLYNIDANVRIEDLFDLAGNPSGTKITLELPI